MSKQQTEIESFITKVLCQCPSAWFRNFCYHDFKAFFLLNSHLHDIAKRCNYALRNQSNNVIFVNNEVINLFAKQILPSEGYLFENGKALPACLFREEGIVPISIFRSSRWYIHETDFLFSDQELLPADLKDCIFKVKTKHGIINISYHAWAQFTERVLNSINSSNKFKKRDYHYYSRRYCLHRLIKMLRGSTPVLRENSLFQLLKYKCKEANYYTANGWILVVEDDQVLRTVYKKGKISEHGYKLIAT